MMLYWRGFLKMYNSIKKIHIFYCPRREFKQFIHEFDVEEKMETLTGVIRQIDLNKSVNDVYRIQIENMVVFSDEYAGVREHVIINFSNFLLENFEIKNLYLHNPPIKITRDLKKIFGELVSIKKYNYSKINRKSLKYILDNYSKKIIGQDHVKEQVLSILLPIITKKKKKPIVILLYGAPGLGKTETAKFIGASLGEKVFRKQFSMLQDYESYNYLFGSSFDKKSFARDLLSRESNVILLDEFDKVDNRLYNAFYQLFDEGVFEDYYYKVDMENTIIICTTNYENENEIVSYMGKALFSRFDSIISFNIFNKEEKKKLTRLAYRKQLIEYPKKYRKIIKKGLCKEEKFENILNYSSLRCNNVREINSLMEKIFSTLLLNEVLKN